MTNGPAGAREPSIGLVTVTYNSADALEQFWARSDAGTYRRVVVDNASRDRSVSVAEGRAARVLVLARNVGFSAANNLGARECDEDVLVFCNPDVTVTEDGIEALAAEAWEHGGIVAPQLLNPDGSPQENGRGTPYPSRKIRHLLRLEDKRYGLVAGVDEVIDVVWVMGAALAVRRADFEALGGWDSGFFVYYEDADLCLRAHEAGMSVRVDGRVRWVHGWARATGRGVSWRAWRYELASAARFYRKHPGCLTRFWKRAAQIERIEAEHADAR